MNSDDIYQRLCQLFSQRDINYDLMNKLNKMSVSNLNNTIKIYLLQFLMDQEDKTAHIQKKDDLWFIKENIDNKTIINKYVDLLINLAKRDDLSNIDIIKEIDPFLDTEIGTKVLYLISILNKFKFPRILLLLYLGFIIGEKIEFIKKNYTLNLMDLLRTVKSGISFIDSKMQIYSLSENSLEILNLYVFSKVFLGDEKNYIYSLENALINSDYNEKMIKIYYHKLEKDKLLDYIFYGKENNMPNEIYKNKSSLLIQDIKVKIKELKDLSKDQLDLELSKNAKFPEDYHEEIKFEIKDEKIDNYHDKNELHPFIQSNINSSNNKSLINEIDLTKNNNQVDIKTSIKSPVDKNEKKIKEEEGVQSHLKKERFNR